jgi:sugar transferase (PEP-CTERM/EpsH1 system associated)
VRIAFVTSRFPFPVEKGDKLRAFHQIRVLSTRHEIHLVSLSHRKVSKEDLDAMSPYCASVKVFHITRWLMPIQLILGWIEGLPLQVAYFLDRTIKRKVQHYIIRLDPDHVICQLIRAVPYVQALPFSKTLDYMDVFSEGMRQRSRQTTAIGFLFKAEAKRLTQYERTVYKDFDHHVIISDQDKERLKLPSREFITVIPNGVDESFILADSFHKPSFDLVFVGNLGYSPNKEAVKVLALQILPLLKSKGRKVSLLVAGARPGRNILKLNEVSNVEVKGWIDDIRHAYRDGRIFVAPMFTGLGLQNKILEAMAMGVPCITTTMVNNAIGARENEEILIGDTPESIVHHIEYLLDHPEEYARIANNARSFIIVHYQWEDQVRRLEEVLVSKNAYLPK